MFLSIWLWTETEQLYSVVGEKPVRVFVPTSEVSEREEEGEEEGWQERLKEGAGAVQLVSSFGGHQKKTTCLSPASALNVSASHPEWENWTKSCICFAFPLGPLLLFTCSTNTCN